jgi:hypothetical protein
MKRKKRGRPPLPKKLKKAERLEIRLSTAELKMLDQLAESIDMTRGELIRHLIEREAKRIGLQEGA